MNNISFPGIGLNFNIDPTAFRLGQKSIYWYAIIILVGIIAGMILAIHSGKKRGVSTDTIFDLTLYGLLAGIIGARLYYVIFDFDVYKDNLLDIFKIWEGGLAVYGGIIGAVIAALIYCRVKKLSFLKIADVCAPSILLGQAIGRYGNFFNAEVFGHVTSLPWGMSINGADPVHPLFLYESLWNLLGVILILIFRDKKKAHGQVFFGYLMWYSFGRFFLEGMRRSDYILYLTKNIGISQVVSVIVFFVSVFMIIYLGKKHKIQPVDGIIFDLDGTLWNSTPTITPVWNQAFKEFDTGVTVTIEDMQSAMGLSIEEIAQKFMPDLSPEEQKKVTDRATQLEAESLSEYGGILYPHLKKTLLELKEKYPLYIVSNCEDGYIESFIKSSKLEDIFEDYEYFARTQQPKSYNIKLLAERNGLKNPVYVGDTEKDRVSSKDAGVKFIHAAYGFGELTEPSQKITEFRALPEAVENLN